ncbi:MAG: thiol-activated cytolysin family protein [Pyrinomonadaceae bacterium]|nr:thiol-activated cytolysin family protein [Pyrinomonadaceae bacterium]MBP6213819.1 thiol-activated cytolysin family protein [Pyrinomonadaceae bacterium]
MRNILIVCVILFLFGATTMLLPSNAGAFSLNAVPQATPERPLTEEDLSALLDTLKENLAELVGDEDKATAIVEKWDAREDLAGKSRKQVLGLLFNDLRSVVTETDIHNKVWAAWNRAPQSTAETAEPETPEKGSPREELDQYIAGLTYDANRLLSVQSTGNQPIFEKVLGRNEQRIPGSGSVTKCTRSSKSLSRNFSDIMVLQPTRGAIYPGSVIIADRGLKDGGPRAVALARAPVNLRVDLPGADNDGGFTVEQPNEANVRNAVNSALGGWNGSDSYREGHVDASGSNSNVAVAYGREQLALELGFDSNWAQGPVSGLINASSNAETTVAALMVKQVFYTVSVDAPESPGGFFADGVTAEQARAAFSSTSVPAYISSVSYGRMMMFMIKTEKRISEADAEAALKYAAGLANVNASQKAAYDSILAASEITASTFGAGGQVTTQTIRTADVARWIKDKSMSYSKTNAGVPVSYTVNFLKDNAAARVGTSIEYSAEDCRVFPNYWLEIRQNGAYMADYTVTWDEPGAPGRKQEGRFSAGNKMQVNFAGDATNIRINLRTMSDWPIVNKVLQPSELNKAYQTGGHATGPSFSVVQTK